MYSFPLSVFLFIAVHAQKMKSVRVYSESFLWLVILKLRLTEKC